MNELRAIIVRVLTLMPRVRARGWKNAGAISSVPLEGEGGRRRALSGCSPVVLNSASLR